MWLVYTFLAQVQGQVGRFFWKRELSVPSSQQQQSMTKHELSGVLGLSSGQYWIGLVDRTGSWDWQWEDPAEGASWLQWVPSYPTRLNDDCAIVVSYGDESGFEDTRCSTQRPALCERENAGAWTFVVKTSNKTKLRDAADNQWR